MDDKAKWADQWFDDLEDVVHPILERDRKDRQKAVRVAILDTGVDNRHPQIQRALELKTIKEVRGFPGSLEPLQDRHGHGTHGASVLMRTAPHAALYIARIADDEGNIAAENHYEGMVKALEWCTENQVDVISISLGIRDEPVSIVEALEEARRRGTIVLASASNEGANDTIAFPAKLDSVFCIGSADGKGTRSSFSPPFMGEEKYSALGEDVLGAWPAQGESEMNNGFYCRNTGTSTAVVIAAGITAFLIDYTRQFMGRGKGADNWENLRKIFLKMSEATAEESYRYLAPRYLFATTKDAENLIKNVLKRPAVLDKRWTSAHHETPKSVERSPQFVERRVATSGHVRGLLQDVNRLVISGLPGVGKTELASQVVWNARDCSRYYKFIFWLNASSGTVFQDGIQNMARQLALIDEKQLITTSADEIREMVLQELNRLDHWLLIMDNLDEVSLLKDFLPERRDTRHVLITTRHRTISSALKAGHLDLDPMAEDEAISLFMKISNKSASSCQQSERQLTQLVNVLGRLPLALVQAAAYLSETQDDVSHYFQFYQSSRKDIWGWKPSQDLSYVTVATVMAISFGKVKESELSVRLFCLLSFLDASNVPETLWTSSDKFQDRLLRDTFRSPVHVNSALQPLLSYNFVQRSGGSISMHRLVQDVMRDLIERDLQDQGNVLDILHDFDRMPEYWVQRAIEIVSLAYPSSCPDTWKDCELYNSHANSCITYGKKYALESETFGDIQSAVGKYTFDQGGYAQSNELFKSALGMYERVCSQDSGKIAEALSDFGRSLARLEKHDEAIEQYERALTVGEIQYAKNPSHSTGILSDIGRSLYCLGKYDLAIRWFDRALRILESSTECDPIQSAQVIACIGAVLRNKKQFRKAQQKCQMALKIEEDILGKDHINSVGLICLLGSILQCKGLFRKSFEQYDNALRIYDNTFGKDHIESAATVRDIGLSYLHLGRCQQALQQFQWQLRITEKTFGRGHISTGNPIWNIGASYLFLGKRKEALDHYQRALNIYGTDLCKCHKAEGGLCATKEEFLRRHPALEENGKLNPLIQNQLTSILLTEKLKLACGGKGFEGKLYRLVALLLPSGIKLYGKYNELGILPMRPLFQMDGPNLYGI